MITFMKKGLAQAGFVAVMLAVILCLAVPVQANSFTETDDAGELAGTAETPIGCGELTEINGSLTTSSDVDLYKIKVTDRDTFEVSTSNPNLLCSLRGYS